MTQNCRNGPKMPQKLAPSEKKSTDISAASAAFCISAQVVLRLCSRCTLEEENFMLGGLGSNDSKDRVKGKHRSASAAIHPTLIIALSTHAHI